MACGGISKGRKRRSFSPEVWEGRPAKESHVPFFARLSGNKRLSGGTKGNFTREGRRIGLEDMVSHQKERIFFIDALRGVCLLGIFAVNMLDFQMPYLYMNPLDAAETFADRAVYIFIDVFAQASFYPLFAFLFGYGMVLISEKAEAKGVNSRPVLTRRLAFLLLLGLLHAFFLWTGDILAGYALCGFLLLPFLRRPGKKLLKTAGILYLVPNLLIAALTLLSGLAAKDLAEPEKAEKALHIYGNGSFLEITRYRMSEWAEIHHPWNLLVMLFMIFPFMLAGAGFAKEGRLAGGRRLFPYYRKRFAFALPAGLVLKTLPYWAGDTAGNVYIQDVFGGPLLSMAFLAGLYLAVNSGYGKKVFAAFSCAGRMSLTNYLFQSLVCTTIFYGYGFSLYGKVSIAAAFSAVIALFAVQVLISRLWLRRFSCGPAEWLWRKVYWTWGSRTAG